MRNDKNHEPEPNGTAGGDIEGEDLIIDAEATFEDGDSDTDSAVLKLKKIKEKLKECEREKQEYLDGWQRAKADLVNYTRQNREETERRVDASVARVLGEILPVVDSFDMAMQGDAWQNIDKDWRVGVEQIASQLKTVLKSHGIEEVEPVGAHFDPNAHECVSIAPAGSEQEDGIIISVVQKGYVRKGIILRPARVVVGQYAPESP